MKNTLKAYERLKSLKSIDYLFSKEGKTIHEEDISLRYAFVKISNYPLQAGFSVSKRLYKKAHDRNLYKRWMREMYRTKKAPILEELQTLGINVHLFFILKNKLDTKSFQDIDAQVKAVIEKLSKKLKASQPKKDS